MENIRGKFLDLFMKIPDLIKIIAEELKDLSSVGNPDFRLEQAEKDADGKTWEVVISYLVMNTNRKLPSPGGLLGSVGGFEYVRLYKTVKVDETGNILGLYIYDNN